MPRLMPLRKRFALWLALLPHRARLLLLGGSVAFAVASCAWLTPSRVRSAAEILDCVISNQHLPPAQIAATCAVDSADEVVDILSAHRTAAAREQANACGKQQ